MRPQPARASGGAYRVQLGAFRDAGNAKSLRSRIGGKVGGSPDYVAAGGRRCRPPVSPAAPRHRRPAGAPAVAAWWCGRSLQRQPDTPPFVLKRG
ncbi:SPOR domain-containing protein [Sphingomonas sp. MMS24-JH45]